MTRGFGLVAAALLIAGPAAAQLQMVHISNPWIRFITPATPAAGYFTITNAGTHPVVIVGASSPACGSLMLHRSRGEGGMARMDMVSEVTVPAHGKVEFAPGGYHLMCTSPGAGMRQGAEVSVTLRFADKHEVTKTFPVRGVRGK